jgi:hypothetical protein
MLNDTTSNNEQTTVYTAEYRDGKATTVDEIGTLYLDLLDLSEEDEITIRWVAANLTCQTAMRRNATYACLSVHSNCLHVYRGNTPLGFDASVTMDFKAIHTSKMGAQVRIPSNPNLILALKL